ncbi:uncharacterized protein [Panulirus ornatus]|uniref:uncharacterized protein n=1 Tax=Panulirus ornatus TaxID=150431 RepID=UPI003A89F596
MSENNEENMSIMAEDAVGPSGAQGQVTVSGKAYPHRYHTQERDETTGVAEALDGGWGWCLLLGTTACTVWVSTQVVEQNFINGQQEGGKNGEESVGLWAKFRAQYNMAVLRDPMIVITALVKCLSFTTAINIFATIPFVLSDAGFSLKEAASAMSAAAVMDLVTCLLAASITDLP